MVVAGDPDWAPNPCRMPGTHAVDANRTATLGPPAWQASPEEETSVEDGRHEPDDDGSSPAPTPPRGGSSPGEQGAGEQVLYRVEGAVAWITLNRPEAGNAIVPAQRDRVIELLGAASADPAIRAVVLGATGTRFCTGADLRGGGSPTLSADPVMGDTARLVRLGAQRLIEAVLDCEKPVVAAVNGTAAGIGAHLAFACDLVVAAEGARFIEVFVRRGIAPDGAGAYLLSRIVGPHRAKELLFLGDDLPAVVAERWGLVNRVVPDAELAATVAELADRLAGGPTRALAAAKWLVNRAADVDRRTALDDEAMVQELVVGTADAREGLTAFAERRAPSFRGM